MTKIVSEEEKNKKLKILSSKIKKERLSNLLKMGEGLRI
jgi:hypothetical protein